MVKDNSPLIGYPLAGWIFEILKSRALRVKQNYHHYTSGKTITIEAGQYVFSIQQLSNTLSQREPISRDKVTGALDFLQEIGLIKRGIIWLKTPSSNRENSSSKRQKPITSLSIVTIVHYEQFVGGGIHNSSSKRDKLLAQNGKTAKLIDSDIKDSDLEVYKILDEPSGIEGLEDEWILDPIVDEALDWNQAIDIDQASIQEQAIEQISSVVSDSTLSNKIEPIEDNNFQEKSLKAKLNNAMKDKKFIQACNQYEKTWNACTNIDIPLTRMTTRLKQALLEALQSHPIEQICNAVKAYDQTPVEWIVELRQKKVWGPVTFLESKDGYNLRREEFNICPRCNGKRVVKAPHPNNPVNFPRSYIEIDCPECCR
jgi:hypothetical protein